MYKMHSPARQAHDCIFIQKLTLFSYVFYCSYNALCTDNNPTMRRSFACFLTLTLLSFSRSPLMSEVGTKVHVLSPCYSPIMKHSESTYNYERLPLSSGAFYDRVVSDLG